MAGKKTAFKTAALIILLIIFLIVFFYVLPEHSPFKATITITYWPEDSSPSRTFIQYYYKEKQCQKEFEVKDHTAVVRIDPISDVRDLSIQMECPSGTAQIEKIVLKTKFSTTELSPQKISDFFRISDRCTINDSEEYLEISTRDASFLELKFLEDKWKSFSNIKPHLWTRVIDLSGFAICISVILISKKRKDCSRQASSKLVRLPGHIFPFLFAFLWCFTYLLTVESMTADSMDANNIWKTITSYFTEDTYASYVLYKGVFSVFPYVWLYQLTLMLHCGEFLFIKIFHGLIFAYITAIGFPAILEYVLNKKASVGVKTFYIGLIFCLQKFNLSYQLLVIDLPYLFWFTLMLHMYLLLKRNCSCLLGKCALLGISLGCCTCFTGQYKFAALFVGCLALFHIWKSCFPRKTIYKISAVMTLFIMAGAIVSAEAAFQANVVEPLRQKENAWMPTASSLVQYQYSKSDPNSIYGYPGLAIKDYQIIAIAEAEKPHYEGLSTTREILTEYLRAGLKHPGEFIVSFANKFFMVFACDNGSYSLFYYWLSYSLLFISLWVIYQNKNILKTKKHILLLFFTSVIAPCATHVEPRYVMAAQNFMFGLAIFDDSIRYEIKTAAKRFLYRFSKNKPVSPETNNWTIWITFIYLCYIMMCIMHLSNRNMMNWLATGNLRLFQWKSADTYTNRIL